MSAGVEAQGNRCYQAWCNDCQDGVNSTRTKAEKWAAEHNNECHKDPK